MEVLIALNGFNNELNVNADSANPMVLIKPTLVGGHSKISVLADVVVKAADGTVLNHCYLTVTSKGNVVLNKAHEIVEEKD